MASEFTWHKSYTRNALYFVNLSLKWIISFWIWSKDIQLEIRKYDEQILDIYKKRSPQEESLKQQKPTQTVSKKNSNKDILWQKKERNEKLISLQGQEVETENNL